MILDTATNNGVNSVQGDNYYYFTYSGSTRRVDITPVSLGKSETMDDIFGATTQQECIEFGLTLGIELTPIDNG